MLWRELSESEKKILMAVTTSQSYSEISRATGLALSYVSAKVKKLARSARLRYWIDYRAIGLSSLLVLLNYDRKLHSFLISRQLPFIKSVARIWDKEGPRLLIEAIAPVGLERRLSQALPLPPAKVWVKEWETHFQPLESPLLASSGGALKTAWSYLPQRVLELKRSSLSVHLKPALNADRIDLMILREKERFCFTSLSEIGRIYGLSQQLVSYHYRLHLRRVWIGNCVEHKLLENAVLCRVETMEPLIAHLLLRSLSESPSIVEAFIPQGEDEVVYVVVDEPLKELSAMHKALFHIEGVKKVELLAYVDADEFMHHGLTVHLGLGRAGWSFDKLEEELMNVSE